MIRNPDQGDEERRALHRRNAMRAFMHAHDLTPAEWARQARLTNANALYNFLNGRSQSLTQVTLERLADAVPGATVTEVIGEGNIRPLNVVVLPVRATAAAGVWRPSYENYAIGNVEIAMPPKMPADEVAKITDDHANLIYPAGSCVTTQNFASLSRPLRGGDKVLVHRVRQGRHEVTVRELREETGPNGQTAAGLVFVSSSPALSRQILPVPWPYHGELWEDGDAKAQIRGRVVMMTVVHDTMD